MRFLGSFRTLAGQETPAERRRRMLPGAMYGLIIASAYGLVGSFVNRLLYPDLPVGVDWPNHLTTWFFLAAWLGMGGLLINWFTQTEESILPGLFAMSTTALAASLFTLDGNLPTQLGKILLLALPILAWSLLMTLLLRWLGDRHAAALEKDPASRRVRIASLVALALAIGGLTGSWLARWNKDTYRAVQDMHARLQTAASDPSTAGSLLHLQDLPGWEAHNSMPYTIHARPSGQSVVAVETWINFQDGYRIACISFVFPDKPPSVDACAEGEKVSLRRSSK
jgi:hypothetical protein